MERCGRTTAGTRNDSTDDEILIAIALILGAFVGISALFATTLNWNLIMVGTASTNALLFVLAILLIMAWKVAGYIGLDRFLLPALGTPRPISIGRRAERLEANM